MGRLFERGTHSRIYGTFKADEKCFSFGTFEGNSSLVNSKDFTKYSKYGTLVVTSSLYASRSSFANLLYILASLGPFCSRAAVIIHFIARNLRRLSGKGVGT